MILIKLFVMRRTFWEDLESLFILTVSICKSSLGGLCRFIAAKNGFGDVLLHQNSRHLLVNECRTPLSQPKSLMILSAKLIFSSHFQ